MIAHLSIHVPKPDHADDLIASMRRFGDAGSGQPGLREVHTFRDIRTGKLVGLSIWESREAFDRGVSAMRAAVENDPFPDWEEGSPEVYLLEQA